MMKGMVFHPRGLLLLLPSPPATPFSSTSISSNVSTVAAMSLREKNGRE
jgi:hypothetical protein